MEDARLALGFPGLGASPGSESFHFSYISRNCPPVQVKSCTMGLGQERHVSELHVLRGRRQNRRVTRPAGPDLTPRPRLFPRTWDLRQLQVWERPVALEAELALTLKVLGTVADGSQGDILDQPLHTLRHMHSELQAVSAQSEAGHRPQGRLHHRVQCLHEAPKKVKSLGCLEASVLFNLFRLLTRDQKCVASGDLCV
ncbi:interferon lambda-3-like [Felis catus]|uniref:interferon lambda-3-like n=1 Tax=Felis catus TaxID=9685 RepID=UPI001D1A3030|nr:interferon lambda-3-like [Felis catus]